MRRFKAIAADLALVVGSVATFLLICELVVFRFILLPSDVPANDFVNGIVRYAPNQIGIWRVRDQIAAPYAINAQGWNSGIGDYALARKAGTRRIAVIGDSYIDAMQVPHDRSVSERLSLELSGSFGPTEALRFGIMGAPLSQYMHVAEREALRYHPDWIVVLIVHNDFDESFRFVQGRYTSSFLKLRVQNGKVVDEIAPQPWRPGIRDTLRLLATTRYFYYRWQLKPQTLRNLIFPEVRAQPIYGANIDVQAVLSDMPANVAVTNHVFTRLKAIARQGGAKLLLAMDGDRLAIYRGDPNPLTLTLNRMVTQAAAQQGIPFIDLNPVFTADWHNQHRRFDYEDDNHWNEHGHAVAAAAIAQEIRAHD